MSNPEPVPARLTAQRNDDGVVLVEIAGDWLDRTGLPDISAVEQALAGGGLSAMEFEAQGLGRWDSALMARILALIEFAPERRSNSAPPPCRAAWQS